MTAGGIGIAVFDRPSRSLRKDVGDTAATSASISELPSTICKRNALHVGVGHFRFRVCRDKKDVGIARRDAARACPGGVYKLMVMSAEVFPERFPVLIFRAA